MSDQNSPDKLTRPGSNEPLSPETYTAQALGHIEPRTRALVPPVHPSSTFERDADGGYSSGRGYARPHNPSYDEPEALLNKLEGGAGAILLGSGMAACTAVFQSLLPGDHVIAPKVMYWALRKWLVEFALPWGLAVEFVDMTNLDNLAMALRPGQTRLVWIETPANPMWHVTDIQRAADLAHSAGARLAVDSTVASPAITRPIEHGADLVVHSASKYLNGHSDIIAGAIVTARTDAFWNRITAWRRDAGAMLGAFEAWLLLRGMRTLFVRVRQASDTALAIATHFEHHPLLVEVMYPGLPSHRDHAVAARQMSGGFSGMLSIRHKLGEAGAMATAANLRVFTRATSLGGVESLVEHRASIEGPSTPVPADLLRLSIGLESAEDLIADLENALAISATQADAEDTAADIDSTDAEAPKDGLEARVQAVLDGQLAPLAAERGGKLLLSHMSGTTVHLTFGGSPGAVVAMESEVEAMIRHYVPEVSEVRLGTRLANQGTDGALATRAEQLLVDVIRPAIAAHGGLITMTAAGDGRVELALGGRCQGCALADVTFRQGVEVLMKRGLPDVTHVVDVTDHSVAPDPYFKTKKS